MLFAILGTMTIMISCRCDSMQMLGCKCQWTKITHKHIYTHTLRLPYGSFFHNRTSCYLQVPTNHALVRHNFIHTCELSMDASMRMWVPEFYSLTLLPHPHPQDGPIMEQASYSAMLNIAEPVPPRN